MVFYEHATVSRYFHTCFLPPNIIDLGSARCTEATSAACSTSTFSKHANPPKCHLCHQPHRQGKPESATARQGRGAQAPCAKGLLNPGDDAHHGVVHRVAVERLGLDGPWRLLVFLVDEVDGRGGALVG